jgi:vancomycin resistance protein YoaR
MGVVSDYSPDPYSEKAEEYLQEIIAGIPSRTRAYHRRQKVKKFLGWTFFTMGLSFSVGWIAYSFTYLPPRVSILGVEVGGLLPPQAYERVLPVVVEQTNLPILIASKDGPVEFNAETLGIAFSLPKTIHAASKNPFTHLWSLVAPISVDPVVEINEEKFKTAIAPIVGELTVQPQNARLSTVDGNIEIYPQTTGQEINWTRSINNVKKSWLQKESSVNLALIPIDPIITDQKIASVAQQVEQILANPIEVLVVDEAAVLNSKELGNALQIINQQDEVKISVDENYLWSYLKKVFPNFDQPTTNAYFDIIDDVPVIVEGNIQIRITPSKFASEFEKKLFDFEDRTVNLVSYAVLPELTTQGAAALNIVEKISEFRQPFPPAEYRAINVGTAANYIDGKILLPGEIFSMNDTIKQRTPQNGYVTGIRIENGRFIEDLGGGVSIITTAMWTAAFYAGLEAIEQRAHSIWIPRYQEGIEATVMWGSLDLKFKNSLDNGILMKTKVEPDGVVITLYGKKKYDQVVAEVSNRYGVTPYKTVYSEAKNCLTQEGQPGFGVSVTRKLIKSDIVVQEDNFRTNYRVGNKVVCGPKPKKKKSEEEVVVEGDLINATE